MGEHNVLIGQLHPEHGAGQYGHYLAFDLDRFSWVYSHWVWKISKAGARNGRRPAKSKTVDQRLLPPAKCRGRSSRARASFTVSARPETSLPLSAAIAALAPVASVKV